MILTLAALCLWAGENRLWYVELELSGTCEELRLDCGSDGETRFLGPFPGGGERRLEVPVPVRSPLGSAGLAALPFPRVEILPANAEASARVLGWSADPRAERLEREARALLTRPRPPSTALRAHAARAELLLVLVAGAFVLRARRRPWLALLIGLGASAGAFGLARTRTAGAGERALVDWEAGGELALAVRTGAGELALPRGRLEVSPEGIALALEVQSSGGGRVLAPGAALHGLEGVPPPALTAEANGGEPLAEVWTRDPSGIWQERGAWGSGAALPPVRASGVPPGWLAGALPPGRAVLLARTGSGAWLRCLGFELR